MTCTQSRRTYVSIALSYFEVGAVEPEIALSDVVLCSSIRLSSV